MKAANMNRQRQLKAYLDRQVNDIKSKQQIEKHKEANEHNELVSKNRQFDLTQEMKQTKIHNKFQENNKYITQTLKSKFQNTGKESEAKTLERIYLLKQMKDLSNKEQKKANKKKEVLNDTKENHEQAIIYKNKQKEFLKQAELREGNQTIQNQIQHFAYMEKRYKDIFQAIDAKDQKIQSSYKKLRPDIK